MTLVRAEMMVWVGTSLLGSPFQWFPCLLAWHLFLAFAPFPLPAYSSFTEYNSANCPSSYRANTSEAVDVPMIIYKQLMPHGVSGCVFLRESATGH